ncbi:unnamed protein product, partial [Symbiodinium microadriaticum]
ELSGAARRLVAGQPPGWVAYRGGVRDDGNHAAESEVNTSTTATHRDTGSYHDWWAPSWTSWGATSWSWNAGWGSYRGAWSYEEQGSSTTASNEDERQPQELLPVFIQGWYLLTDAALDSHERNLVVTALNGNFNPARVAQELRNQFSEQEVKRRDQRARHQSYLGETMENIDDEEETEEFANEDLDHIFNEEGFAMMSTAEDEAQTALAAIQTAKRTLREARHKQHQVKQNRKYYQTSSSRNPSSVRTSRPSRRQLPHKPIGDGPPQSNLAQAGSSSSEPQQAPFVCYLDEATADNPHECTEGPLTDFVGYATDECFQATDATAAISTSEAVAQGMAVIDGG